METNKVEGMKWNSKFYRVLGLLTIQYFLRVGEYLMYLLLCSLNIFDQQIHNVAGMNLGRMLVYP